MTLQLVLHSAFCLQLALTLCMCVWYMGTFCVSVCVCVMYGITVDLF